MIRKPGPKVDTSAPLLQVEHVLKTSKFVRDLGRQRTLMAENRELVKKINQIYRTKGFLNVDYSFRVHRSLHSEARVHAASVIERENRLLLARLLSRKPTVNSNFRHGRKETPSTGGEARQLMVDFWERTDRWLCQLTINICPEVSLGELALSDRRKKIFRIFSGMCLVLQSRQIPHDEEVPCELHTLQNVQRGCLVRQWQGNREHLFVMLRQVATIADGWLLGRVNNESMAKLELLSYYGTKFGPCKEPIYYGVSFTESGQHRE